MSKSGIPGASQLGSTAGDIGGALGEVLGGPLGGATGLLAAGPAASAVSGVIDPSAPTPAAPPTLSAGNAEASAETDEEETRGKGMAADMLTGGSGVMGNAPVARNVLLGS